jgi:hypothetical protein
MGQNKSSAVMQQRFESRESLDDFPTPPWATRALFQYMTERRQFVGQSGRSAWDPAANRGHMVRVLCEQFHQVVASDIADYGAGFYVQDFLLNMPSREVDWIVTNPPFNVGAEFVERALPRARVGVAMLVRQGFLSGQERYETLFRSRPPLMVLQFAERVVMLRGRLVRANEVDPLAKKPGTKASTATDYAWLVWLADDHVRRMGGGANSNPAMDWIPPCRTRLERPGDYPADVTGLADIDRSRLVA